jgi:ribosomal protein S18 acetylase RimI-like enzyme
LFATASLARRIERAESTLISEGALAAARRLDRARMIVAPVAGGVAVFTETGSPFNKFAGLGFEGVPEIAQLEGLEQEYEKRGSPLQVELASLAEPAVGRLLTRRGYELVGYENVLGLPLTPEALANVPAAAPDSGVTVAAAGPDDGLVWIKTVTEGFLHPDTFDGPAGHESFDRSALERVYGDTIAAPSFEQYLARRKGTTAGGAAMRLFDGIAQLCGAATLPDHRRQGVQTSLLRHRLVEAAGRGCDVAVVTTQPGSKSHANVQRIGFALLYVRGILIKPATA